MRFKRSRERGQTIALVAVSMVSLLAMAAIAIDLTTLYVARGEIQRAADSAALAGAKAFVDSGITTNPATPTLQALAQLMANSYASAAVLQNKVAGAPAQIVGTPAIDFSLQGNPRIAVRLQRTDLPVFFAKIFGNTAASVGATATAEAFNSSYSQTNVGTFLPPAPKCVKPFLVPNNDAKGIPMFVTTSTGVVNSTPLLGQLITFTSACRNGQGQAGCAIPGNGNGKQSGYPATTTNGGSLSSSYVPLLAASTHLYCPSLAGPGCSNAGNSDFEQSVRCCDGAAFDFNQCGSSVTRAPWDQSMDPGGPNRPTQSGLQCLIHSPNQDLLNATAFASGTGAPQISPGTFSVTRYNISTSSTITTSDSIITVPVFDNPQNSMPARVKIVAFLQLFVNDTGPGQNDFNAYILNVVGCGDKTSSGSPVSGGGGSAIPVRLVQQ